MTLAAAAEMGSVSGVARKVIYVAFGRLTDKMARDWYIDYLIAQGARVEYWDIVALVREEHSEHGALTPRYLRVFASYAQLELALRDGDNRDALFVMLLSYNGKLARVFQLLTRESCRMVNFAWGVMPHAGGLSGGRLLALAAEPRRAARAVLDRLRASALRRLHRVAPFVVTFAAGAVSMAASAHADRVVAINYFDYDLYVQAKRSGATRLFPGRYAVFLDSNLPHHSDLAFCGYGQVDAARYYRALNRFFDLLEQRLGCPVLIAAHPRASDAAQCFGGRPAHRLLTAELVRDAELVLSHTSTAMSFAVLNHKPLLFIYSDDMAKTYRRSLMREMRCFAGWLDAGLCNIDSQQVSHLTLPAVNRQRYERYKYDFLTSPQSEGMPTREILWRELRAE